MSKKTETIDNFASLCNIDDIFLIQWIGPFNSPERCSEWEKKNCRAKEYNFYFAKGKIRGKVMKKPLKRFYIGKSERNFVSERISESSNPIMKDFKRIYGKEIWIGRFSDNNLRSLENEKKSECVEIVEWGLIFGFRKANPDKILLNEKKTANPPKRHICIVNQFFNKDSFKILRRKTNIAKYIPDVILYGGDDCIKLCQTLRKVDSEE